MLFFLCMICLISFVIWAFVSYGISGWLVKPMENALEKQNEFISAAGHIFIEIPLSYAITSNGKALPSIQLLKLMTSSFFDFF